METPDTVLSVQLSGQRKIIVEGMEKRSQLQEKVKMLEVEAAEVDKPKEVIANKVKAREEAAAEDGSSAERAQLMAELRELRQRIDATKKETVRLDEEKAYLETQIKINGNKNRAKL